jgi:hypothetical protein
MVLCLTTPYNESLVFLYISTPYFLGFGFDGVFGENTLRDLLFPFGLS